MCLNISNRRWSNLIIAFDPVECEICHKQGLCSQYYLPYNNSIGRDCCLNCIGDLIRQQRNAILVPVKKGMYIANSNDHNDIQCCLDLSTSTSNLAFSDSVQSFLWPTTSHLELELQRGARFHFLTYALMARGSVFRDLAGHYMSTYEDVIDRIMAFLCVPRWTWAK